MRLFVSFLVLFTFNLTAFMIVEHYWDVQPVFSHTWWLYIVGVIVGIVGANITDVIRMVCE